MLSNKHVMLQMVRAKLERRTKPLIPDWEVRVAKLIAKLLITTSKYATQDEKREISSVLRTTADEVLEGAKV